jgi:hypothetical protein
MCLGQEDMADLRAPLRASPDDAALEAAIRAAIARKPKGHDFDYSRQAVQGQMSPPHEPYRRLSGLAGLFIPDLFNKDCQAPQVRSSTRIQLPKASLSTRSAPKPCARQAATSRGRPVTSPMPSGIVAPSKSEPKPT